MKYNVKQLKAILEKIESSDETVYIHQFSGGQGLKFDYKETSLGFPTQTTIELAPIDE